MSSDYVATEGYLYERETLGLIADDGLPILPERRIAHSGGEALHFCPRSFAIGGPCNWRGWEKSAPAIIRQRYDWRYVSNYYGWSGTLFHDWAYSLQMSEIDSAIGRTTGVLPLENPLEILRSKMMNGFEESARFAQQGDDAYLAYLRDPSRKQFDPRERREITYLVEHSRWAKKEKYSWDPRQWQHQFRQRWEIADIGFQAMAEKFLRHRKRYTDNAPFESWGVIEGHALKNGLMIGNPRESQRMLREKKVYPAARLIVDGDEWLYGYNVDCLVFLPASNEWLLVDWKTGKKRASNREQLMSYAALLIRDMQEGRLVMPWFPPISRKNLRIRLIYLQESENNEIVEFQLGAGDEAAAMEIVSEHIREYRRRLVLIDDILDKRATLLKILPPALVLDREGKFREDYFPSGTLVPLPEMFELKGVEEATATTCGICTRREICPEGQEHYGLIFRDQRK